MVIMYRFITSFPYKKNILPILLVLVILTLSPISHLGQESRSDSLIPANPVQAGARSKKVKKPMAAKILSHELWFKSNGQLISYPPELLQKGEKIGARVTLDANFWTTRVTTTLNSWLNILEILKKPVPRDAVYTFGDGKFNNVMAEMVHKMNAYINGTSYIPNDQKNYYLKRIGAIGVAGAAPVSGKDLTPPIENLIIPEYYIEYFFYNDKNERINSKGKPFCTGDDVIQNFKPCDDNVAVVSYKTDEFILPLNCYEVKYRLRLKNNTIAAMMSWALNDNVIFPIDYADQIVKAVEEKFGEAFMKKLAVHNAELDKLRKDPLDRSIDLKKLNEFVDEGLSNISAITGRLKEVSANNQYKDWVAHWLWLTSGIPQMNPFASNVGIFPEKSAAKVSAHEKALYQIFELMVLKGALRINELIQIDSNFKNIPRIKAAMDAEALQQTNEPMLQDRLLYEGILKPSPNGDIFMRHLDVLTNYIIMGVHPKKEITENERMFILVENKSVPLKISIAFEAVTIASEDAQLTNEINNSAADRAEKGAEPVKSKAKKDKERKDSIDKLIPRFEELFKKAIALRALPQAPSLPIYFEKDLSPDYISDNLEHDYMYDAPAAATYTVKQTNPDNTEKEVAKGGYRINKLYHWRLKAGLVYSFLKKRDYTEVSTGHYSLDNPGSGIDGTFGIQYYFNKQDIRSKEAKIRGFGYVGLSMRKITENFYVGLGTEPIAGLAISFNAHIGKREGLTGNNSFPSGIKSTWGVHFAPSILVDASLFVKLFTFGSTNKALIGF